MFKCNLCNQEFKHKSKLERHKNIKTPCNKPKESTKCELCDKEFTCLANLEKHKKSKKHTNIEKQYIIDNSTNIINNIDNSITNNINVTVRYGFIETNIDIIELKDIEKLLVYEDKIHAYIKVFEKYPDEIYGDGLYLLAILKFFIKIFEKLNFNLAFSENHNCSIYQFIKSNADINYIEYHLLEIDNNKFNYNTEIVDYKIFIEKFINLMRLVINKFDNITLNKILVYVNRYYKMLISSDNARIEFEKELFIRYTEFKESKNSLETEEEIFQKDRALARSNAFKDDIRLLNSLRFKQSI